jgi:hypothetical protein
VEYGKEAKGTCFGNWVVLGKPKIIDHLITINKYQSIPSIPSVIHAYGYTENEHSGL